LDFGSYAAAINGGCKMKLRILFLFLSTLFLACSDTNVADLNVTFDDPNWDGVKVPKVGQCKNCGGEGLSPALRIKNIPPDTGLIIIEFNDKSMPALSKGGGHGAVSFKVENKTEIIVPSIGEQTLIYPRVSKWNRSIERRLESQEPIWHPVVVEMKISMKLQYLL
jgi:hypothetical protein